MLTLPFQPKIKNQTKRNQDLLHQILNMLIK